MDQLTPDRLAELIAAMETMLADLDTAGTQLAAAHLATALETLRAIQRDGIG